MLETLIKFSDMPRKFALNFSKGACPLYANSGHRSNLTR
jgi:hypothetical protein